MQPNVWIWATTLGILANTVLTLTGTGLELMGTSTGHPVAGLIVFLLGLVGPALALGVLAALARPFLQESGGVTRPPLFNLVVVTALCGAATAVYQCVLGGTSALLSAKLAGFLLALLGTALAGYGFWRVARLHVDPEGELSAGLLAGIGGMLLLVGAPLTGIFCLVGAGYAASQG